MRTSCDDDSRSTHSNAAAKRYTDKPIIQYSNRSNILRFITLLLRVISYIMTPAVRRSDYCTRTHSVDDESGVETPVPIQLLLIFVNTIIYFYTVFTVVWTNNKTLTTTCVIRIILTLLSYTLRHHNVIIRFFFSRKVQSISTENIAFLFRFHNNDTNDLKWAISIFSCLFILYFSLLL